MKRDKLIAATVVCLALVHANVVATVDIRTSPNVTIHKINTLQKTEIFSPIKEFNILAFAFGLYELDARERVSKESIKERLMPVSDFLKERLEISFDLDRIDELGNKGFTRYYPFTVGEKDYIIRIFDINEREYQPYCDLLYEDKIDDLEIGFQIMPGIKTLLSDKKIEKTPGYRSVRFPLYP
ncbi:MAG: hypothetical protein ABID09_01415 [Candidatus Omnitrophota bacterium]